MAVKPVTLSVNEKGVAVADWQNMAGGDTGSPVSMPDYPEIVAQAVGDATNVFIEGSNDGTNWKQLKDQAGATIDLQTLEVAVVLENTLYMRPTATGGTSTDVTLVGSGKN